MKERVLNSIIYILLAVAVFLFLDLAVIHTIPAIFYSNEGVARGAAAGENADRENTAGDDTIKGDASSVFLEVETRESGDISTVGYHIYVDLDLTQMYVYKDGELVKTYEVSGGKASSPSPEGTWKIINKDTWGEGFGGAWLGFNVPWGMYGIHGTAEPWTVGRSNSSKGCIRMKNADALELFDMIPYNTQVTIVHKNKTFHPMRDGDTGSEILNVEKALKILGYYNGSEDGIFGPQLTASVKMFQKDYGLYRTGVVNISTYELITRLVKEMED